MSIGQTTNNRLYYGDNLDVMRKHISNDSVDLCYIDPPFNSNREYHQIYNRIGGEDRAIAQAFTDTWIWGNQANEGFEEILANEGHLFTTDRRPYSGATVCAVQR